MKELVLKPQCIVFTQTVVKYLTMNPPVSPDEQHDHQAAVQPQAEARDPREPRRANFPKLKRKVLNHLVYLLEDECLELTSELFASSAVSIVGFLALYFSKDDQIKRTIVVSMVGCHTLWLGKNLWKILQD